MIANRTKAVRSRGFTLVELIITVAIIAVLAGLAVTALGVFSDKNDVRRTETTLQLLQNAVDTFETEAGRPVSWGLSPSQAGSTDVQSSTPHVLSSARLLVAIDRVDAVSSILGRISPDALVSIDSTAPKPTWLAPGSAAAYASAQDPNGFDASAVAESQFESGALDGLAVPLDAWGEPIRMVHPGPTREDFVRIRSSDEVGTPGNYGLADEGPPFFARVSVDTDDTVRLDGDSMLWLFTLYQDANIPVDVAAFAGGFAASSTEDVYGSAEGRSIYFVSSGPDRRFGDRTAAVGSAAFEATLDNVYSADIGAQVAGVQ